MSPTKVLIIVLVLIGLIFVAFIARGAFRGEFAPTSDKGTAAKMRPSDWTKTIKGLFKSVQPALELN